jgi:subtilisin
MLLVPPKTNANYAQLIQSVVGVRLTNEIEWAEVERLARGRERYALHYPALRAVRTNAPRELLERHFGREHVVLNFPLVQPSVRSRPLADADSHPEALKLEAQAESWARKAVAGQFPELDGSGIRVCVVDTGIRRNHPDFVLQHFTDDRLKAFTLSGTIEDERGHGTHCAGIVCGPEIPGHAPRYGIAPRAQLFVANVFGDAWSTDVFKLVAALDWAVSKRCHIVSMSLYKPANPADDAEAGKLQGALDHALAQGTMLVACTGNESDRANNIIEPARFPASLDGVLAVGGLDEKLALMNESNGGESVVDPGNNIWSAYHSARGYAFMSGTSMATACAAGVTALHAQKFPNLRGRDLLNHVVSDAAAKPLHLLTAP